MQKYICVALCVFVLGSASSLLAGGGNLTGQERRSWGDDGYSVILARVKEVKTISEPDAGTHEVKFEPMATIAGHFDPSESDVIVTRLYAHQFTTSIADVPPVGSYVLAVIAKSLIAGDPKRPCLFVESMWCKFMPEESGLVVVDGPADKRILETLDRIRKARAVGVEHEKREAVQEKSKRTKNR